MKYKIPMENSDFENIFVPSLQLSCKCVDFQQEFMNEKTREFTACL